jgi:nitrate reductase delta subunit
MKQILERETLVNPSLREGLCHLIDARADAGPLMAESEYVSLFDSSRSLSLHLFEHVHGDSRERGTAMSDLVEQYRNRGLEITADELPDYMPLFLEFLSLQPLDEARAMLAEVSDILGLLQARLAKRASNYAVVFRALCAIARAQLDPAALANAVAAEKPVDIDKEWEEAPVRFDLPLSDEAAADCRVASAMVQRMEREIAGAPGKLTASKEERR